METSRLCRATALALGFALVGGAGVFAGTLTVRPGVPSVGGVARYTGTHGLEVDVAVPDRNPAYVQSSHPVAESVYRLRFFVNLRGLTMTNGNEFDVFAASDGADPTPPTTTGNVLFRAVARQTAGKKVLSAFVRTDVGSEVEIPSEVILADGWRMVEIDWAKSTAGAAGTGNGHFTLWVDGVQKANLGSLDNDNGTVNYARLGAVNGVDAATSGTAKFDDFASQRTGYIGVIQLFSDVPTSYAFFKYIQGLYASEITSGCAVGQFCPDSSITREQMAVFLVRGVHGATFVPPPATGIFSDVPVASFYAPYIEQLYTDGITSGCGTSPLTYCPSSPVTRAQMAVFLLRSKHGSGYTPPAPAGIFSDVPADFFRPYIEQLYNEAITSGCGTSPLVYCPTDPATRGQMAVFLIRTFSLPPQEIGP
ncbi:MAG: S-layer homology domain-containing protein [Thermoanaerobaculia bacterium]